jgi:hypothetical protein
MLVTSLGLDGIANRGCFWQLEQANYRVREEAKGEGSRTVEYGGVMIRIA